MEIDTQRIVKAHQEMVEWLRDPRELGTKPAQLEYVDAFTDEDGIECLIFKFRKSVLSKWMIGIVSDSGVFSHMKIFNKDTAMEDAAECLNFLKDYWKAQAAKQESEDDAGTKGRFSGFILLSDKSWDKEQFKRDMKSDWNILTEETEDEGDEEAEEQKEGCDALIFEVGTQRVMLGYMDMPIPDGEAEHNAAFNYTWKEAVEVTKTHQAQIIVAIMGEHKNLMEDGELFVKVVSVLCKQRNAIGVYANGVVYQPEFYFAMREFMQKGMFPILGLVWFGIMRTEKGYNVYTIGMKNFGKDEMEILDSGEKPQELKDFLIDVASYCIQEDVAFRDGETVGMSAKQRCRITKSPGVCVEGMTLKIAYQKH